MWTDVVFCVGIVLLLWGVLRAVTSLLDRYDRRRALAMLALGSALVLFADYSSPDGYSLQQAPLVMIEVIATLV